MKRNNLLKVSFIATVLFVVFFSFSGFGQTLPAFYGNGALAVPNNLINYEQADGTTLNVYLQGDAVINWFTSEDGFAVLRNNDEIFEYAVKDVYGNLVPSGIKANNKDARTSAEIALLNQTEKSLFYSDSQVKEFQDNAVIGGQNDAKMGGFPTTGTRKLLMILANFSNTTTSYTQTNFDNYMNQANYNSTGSFKDYYYEVSYGLLTVNTTVTVWVKVPNTHDYYGPDAKWAEFVRDAVNAADASGVDFTQFDNDGNGAVDGVAVIHQGPGQEETGNTSDIWSHNWSLADGGFNVVKDGKTVSNYTCQPEKSGSGIATIGVMCHEFGHNLGAPDYYDTDYATGGQYEGTGYWDMMASGSYNGSPGGSKPAHHNAWTKMLYGWLTPTTLSSAISITATNVEQNAVAYKFTTTTTNEYYLIENRQKVGFDSALPGQGLFILHIHKDALSTYDNNDLNNTHPQKVYPVCASATTNPSSSASSYGSTNTAGCAYPYSTKTSLTDATTPWAKSWAGANTAKPVTNIVLNSTTKVVTFDFMGGGGTTPTAPTATTNSASGISTTSASLNGTVTANNATTTVTFEYGLTTSYGSTINATPNTLTGTTSTAVSASLSGLTANTTYNYRVKAVNSAGTTYGSNVAFTTTANPTSYTIPFTENFSSTFPTNWTQQKEGTSITDRWATSNTANAGGTAYEMKCTYQQVNPGTTRLVTPAINTTGYTSLNLSFKHMLDAYGTGVTLKVQTSNNGTTWTDAWSVAGTATNIAAATQAVTLTTNLGSTTTYVAFVVTGNLYQIDYWYVDNVSITASAATAPTVTTTTASAITSTTATSGGNVTAAGSSSVTARGVCWATTTNPTTANFTTSNGTGTGSYTSSLTGLTAGNTYYIRAYATNAAGTSYGSQVSFTTTGSATAPTVSTTAISTITSTSANSGGNVSSDGGAAVTARGVCWATTSTPTTANSKTIDGSGTGTFSSSITGLTANTLYYVRAYATNSVGTTYGTQVSFTTSTGSVTYCTSNGSSIVYEWIDKVQLGTINNVTTASTGGYGNYTAQSTYLVRNTSNTIYLSCGFKSTAYSEYFKVYIDYNKDGDFADSGELVGSLTATAAATTYSKAFTVPSTAALGTTRMRVVMSDNSASSYCGSYSYGETEDYTVNITSSKEGMALAYSDMNAVEGTDFVENSLSVYPNPSADVISLNLSNEQILSVQIYSINGVKVLDIVVDEYNTTIDVNDLATGTYIVKMYDGQKSFTDKFIKY
jgi:M6 family metalloprotease-like protein